MVTKKVVSLPQDFSETLEANTTALAAFESMRPSCQKRYVTWIEDAKRPETRERRIKKALEMAKEWQQRRQNPKLKSANI